MCVGSPTAGTWSSSPRRSDNEFKTNKVTKPVVVALLREVRTIQTDHDRRCRAQPATGYRPLASSACSAYTECMQYTIRRIPAALDHALRQRARASNKSLNEAAVDALAEGSGMAGKPRKRRDLRDISGTWKPDKAVDRALAAQDQIDADLWR
jgi:hypothetical protein